MIIKIFSDVSEETVREALDLLDIAESEYEIENETCRRSLVIDWLDYIGRLKNKQISIAQIARETSLAIGTVRNNLIKNGYTPVDFTRMSKATAIELENDLRAGESINELCQKYQKSPQHIRLVKRKLGL